MRTSESPHDITSSLILGFGGMNIPAFFQKKAPLMEYSIKRFKVKLGRKARLMMLKRHR